MRSLVLLLCFFWPVTLHGQVNTEKLRMARDANGISGQVELAFSLTLGNSKLAQLDFGPAFVARRGRHQAFVLSDLSWVSSNEVSVVNRGFGHVRYNVDLTARLIGEAFTQIQYDRAQNLKSRFLLGGGVRMNLVKRPTGFAAVGASAMYEHEEQTDGQTSDSPRGSSYLSLSISSPERAALSSTVYLQPALDDFEDLRVLQETRVALTVVRRLALVVTFNYRLDTRPPAGIRRYDLKLKNGLTISL